MIPRTSASPRGRPRTRTTLIKTVLLAGLLAFLPGCSPHASELSADSAAALSSRLGTVRAAAAANDHDGALRELEHLEDDLEGEAANGGMTFARFQSIRSALQLVRTDLQALVQAAADEQAAEAAAEAAKAEAAHAEVPVPAEPAPAVDPSGADQTPADAAPTDADGQEPGRGPGQGNGKAKSEEAAQRGKGP